MVATAKYLGCYRQHTGDGVSIRSAASCRFSSQALISVAAAILRCRGHWHPFPKNTKKIYVQSVY